MAHRPVDVPDAPSLESLVESGVIELASPHPGGLEISFHLGDAFALPFPDGAFDIVICECTLCLLDKAVALAEMVRVVRPGGRSAFTTWHGDRPLPND